MPCCCAMEAGKLSSQCVYEQSLAGCEFENVHGSRKLDLVVHRPSNTTNI